MIYESPSDPALTDWLNICDFEALFWEESIRIQNFDRALANERPSFVQQHPSTSHVGPGAKHVDEWLPLLLFGKHIAGDMRYWDSTVEVCTCRTGCADPKTQNGCSFDALYRIVSNQPHISPDREGYLEITRAMNPRQGADLVRRDREISRIGMHMGIASKFGYEVHEVEQEVLRAVLRKAAKHYEPHTTLIIWLREEPRALSYRLDDPQFLKDVKRACNGVFAGICVVGFRTGVKWLLGDGLQHLQKDHVGLGQLEFTIVFGGRGVTMGGGECACACHQIKKHHVPDQIAPSHCEPPTQCASATIAAFMRSSVLSALWTQSWISERIVKDNVMHASH